MVQHAELATKFLKILSAYSVIHVLAQELGIESSKKQLKRIKKIPIQLLILYAGAYFATEDIQLAAITTGIFYYLKHM